MKLNPCPHCSNENIDPEFWQVGEKTGPGCPRCGATATTVEAWQRGEISEPKTDY